METGYIAAYIAFNVIHTLNLTVTNTCITNKQTLPLCVPGE